MVRQRLSGGQRIYLTAAVAALACAAAFAALDQDGPLPGIGTLPVLPSVAGSALLGFAAVSLFEARTRGAIASRRMPRSGMFGILGLGALLAVPPIAIDLVHPFPRGMNVPWPAALVYYPAVALVAEVAFHLLPLASLSVLLSRPALLRVGVPVVVLVEPAFQSLAMPRFDGQQARLVFGNVALISAAQLWLFRRHGFGAMFALRLAFYFFWHGLWGTARLALLF